MVKKLYVFVLFLDHLKEWVKNQCRHTYVPEKREVVVDFDFAGFHSTKLLLSHSILSAVVYSVYHQTGLSPPKSFGSVNFSIPTITDDISSITLALEFRDVDIRQLITFWKSVCFCWMNLNSRKRKNILPRVSFLSMSIPKIVSYWIEG